MITKGKENFSIVVTLLKVLVLIYYYFYSGIVKQRNILVIWLVDEMERPFVSPLLHSTDWAEWSLPIFLGKRKSRLMNLS